MLMECPRCGFSQPQDQYCAKCGIDVVSFKQKTSQPPRKSSGLLLYAIIFLVIVGMIVIFMRRHVKEEIETRVQFIKGGLTLASPSLKQPNPGPTNPISKPEVRSVESLSPEAPARPLSSPKAVLPQNESKVSETIQVNLIFAEVDRTLMEVFRNESRATGQFVEFGDFRTGIVPSFAKMANDRGVRLLQRVSEKLARDHVSATHSIGTTKPDGTFIGITYSITLTQIETNNLRGEFEIMHTFYESSDFGMPPVQRSYPSTTFDLNTGQSWMVTLSPPSIPQDEIEAHSSEGIMRLFHSPQYRSRQTEFAVFLDFDKITVK